MPGLGGGGGQPNLGNACILGVSGPATPPLYGPSFGAVSPGAILFQLIFYITNNLSV